MPRKTRKAPAKSGRGGGTGGRKKSRLPVSIKEHSKAVDTIGRENIKGGSHLIGISGIITPTKRGFNSVSNILKEIHDVKSAATFTYKLRIVRPSGEIVEINPRPSNIIPRHKREVFLGKKVKAASTRGGAKTKAVRELFMERIRSEVFSNRVKLTKDQSEAFKQLFAESKREAYKYLEELLGGKTRFQIEIYRET